jgi:hypothetical protein
MERHEHLEQMCDCVTAVVKSLLDSEFESVTVNVAASSKTKSN